MIYYVVSDSVDPYYNLSLEKLLCENYKAESKDLILYFWVNQESVIIGRNQNPLAECDLYQMTTDGILLARRSTGGGAVYHDKGNLNFSIIGDGDIERDNWIDLICKALSIDGITAEKSGRNDITINEKKVSGCAFERGQNYYLFHGCIMVNVKRQMLSKYLTPSISKLQKHGIASVSSRTANLVDFYPSITVSCCIERIKTFFSLYYGTSIVDMDESVLNHASLLKLSKELASEDWLMDDFGEISLEKTIIYENIEYNFLLHINDGLIINCVVETDSLEIDDISQIEQILIGRRLHELKEKDITSDAIEVESNIDAVEIIRKLKDSISDYEI